MDRRKIIRITLLVIAPLLLIVFILNGPSFVTIESEQGANLSVTTSKDGSFKKIGTTKVTHVFFKKPSSVYVSAELNGKQTITSVKLKRFTRQSVELKLTDTVPVKKVSDGAVIDAIFSGNMGQGIVYGQDTLVNFRTDSPDTKINPEFVGLPYIKKVVWYDFNNFVYKTDEGMGQFVNGTNRGANEVGTTISGDVSIDPDFTTSQGTPIIVDMSKTGNKPLVLLSRTNIFTSNDMGTTFDAITSFEQEKRDISIFTSSDSIFKVSNPELGHTHEDDGGHGDKHSEKPQITVEEFSYTGEITGTMLLDDDSSVVSIVRKNGVTYILTLTGLHTVRDSEIQRKDLYFSNPADMTLYKDQVVVLANDGLWRIGEDGSSFQLLFRYTDYGVGLTSSMSVDPNNQLVFGTTQAENQTSNTATFTTSF